MCLELKTCPREPSEGKSFVGNCRYSTNIVQLNHSGAFFWLICIFQTEIMVQIYVGFLVGNGSQQKLEPAEPPASSSAANKWRSPCFLRGFRLHVLRCWWVLWLHIHVGAQCSLYFNACRARKGRRVSGFLCVLMLGLGWMLGDESAQQTNS